MHRVIHAIETTRTRHGSNHLFLLRYVTVKKGKAIRSINIYFEVLYVGMKYEVPGMYRYVYTTIRRESTRKQKERG